MAKEYRRCTRCLLDTTVPEIVFDDLGVCQYCNIPDISDISRNALGKGSHPERLRDGVSMPIYSSFSLFLFSFSGTSK
jgi:hypothetical protein